MASENPFKGNLTSLLKPGGGEFGKFYSLPSLKDPRAGCTEGIGKENFLNGAGGGAGHGGRGGSGYFNGRVSIGGDEYGNAIFPCRGGMIVDIQ
ncbi:hypothetical protein HN51_050732 [Arachis hypogaea]